MSDPVVTGRPAIDKILQAINKEFNGAACIGIGPQIAEASPISTGSVGLDCLLSIGGIPDNRITEIYGPPSSGKTSLALQILREYQLKEAQDAVTEGRPERWACFIDIERTTGLDLIQGIGVDTSKLICAAPLTAEAGLNIAENLGKSGEIGFILFDSVDAAETEAEARRDIGEMAPGGLARIMSQATRKLSKICDTHRVCYVFINQIRYKIGVMYGNPETVSGGNGLTYYSSVRLRVTSQRSKTNKQALLMSVKVVKNKYAFPFNRNAEFLFIPGQGTDRYDDLISAAKSSALMRSAGKAVKVTFPGEEELQISSSGQAGARTTLESDPALVSKLTEAIYTQILSGVLVEENADDDTE